MTTFFALVFLLDAGPVQSETPLESPGSQTAEDGQVTATGQTEQEPDKAAGEQQAGPDDYGPFFEGPPASDTRFSSKPRGPIPLLSVGGGKFCFVEDAVCKMALLATADVSIGLRVLGKNGPDLPFGQFTVRGGFSLRPFDLIKGEWHPWSVGIVGSWSRATGSVRLVGEDEVFEDPRKRTDSWRMGLLNQLWLSRKAHALHLDFTLGMVRSDVLGTDAAFRLFGTHAEFGVGFGGWGALFASGDFLDEDVRVVFGFRMHGIAGAPLIGLVAAGMAAGGTL